MSQRLRIAPHLLLLALLSILASTLTAQQPDPQPGYILPPDPVQDLFATDPNFATLDHLSPDGDHFVIPLSTELSTLEEVGEETLRLAMLEIRARTDRPWHLDLYGLYGLRFYSLSERSFTDVDLPDGIHISDLMWSPDGSRLAFLAHLEDATQVWIASTADGSVQPAGDARVIATLGTSSGGQGSNPSRMLQWTPSGSLITLAAPADRGPEPPAPALPSGPSIRHTRATATPTRTMPFLLEDEHDGDLFEHYTRSQIVELVPGRPARPIGEPGMFESVSLSPGGSHLMATRIERPFSFIASYTGFPRVTEVLDVATGEVLATLEERELREGAAGDRRTAPAIGGGAPTAAGSPFSTACPWVMARPRVTTRPQVTTPRVTTRPQVIRRAVPPIRTPPARTASCSSGPPSEMTTRSRSRAASIPSRRPPIPPTAAMHSPPSPATTMPLWSTTPSTLPPTPPPRAARWSPSTTPATHSRSPGTC